MPLRGSFASCQGCMRLIILPRTGKQAPLSALGAGASVVTGGMQRSPCGPSIDASPHSARLPLAVPAPPRPVQPALPAELIPMLVCLCQHHIAVVSRLVPPQTENRHSACFSKEQAHRPLARRCVPFRSVSDSSSHPLPSKALLSVNGFSAGRQRTLVMSHS